MRGQVSVVLAPWVAALSWKVQLHTISMGMDGDAAVA